MDIVKNILKEELNLIQEAEKKDKEPKGCLMVDLSHKIKNWNSIIKMIEPDDIFDDASHEYGLELEPHVTILYGFDQNVTSKDIKTVTDEVTTNIELSLTGISIFPGKEGLGYDVVKFDIESDDLHKLNEMCKSLPHTTTFPDYHPHMTIAYVKKGTGERYVKKFKPMEMEGNTFLYSLGKGKTKSHWKIKKKYNFVIDLTGQNNG